MTERPTFYLTKGMRGQDDGLVSIIDILQHYAEAFAHRIVWDGGPKDMPKGFIEKAIFWCGNVAPLRAFGESQITAAWTSLKGIYGQPISWIPVPPDAAEIPRDFMQQYDAFVYPVLHTEIPMAERIRPLCEMMASAYRCLLTTIISMQQPVVVQGAVGGEVNMVETGNKIRNGDLKIYTLDRTGMGASVLDLGGKDHTQNLIATINALDCEILARMGIKSAGTEKASGVTTEETISITQELSLTNRFDLEIRKKWLEDPKIKEMFPDLTVRLAPELEVIDDERGYSDDERTSMSGSEIPGDADRRDGGSENGSEDDGGLSS